MSENAIVIKRCEEGNTVSGKRQQAWQIRPIWFKFELSFDLVVPTTVCFNAPLARLGTWHLLDERTQAFLKKVFERPNGLLAVELSTRIIRYEIRRKADAEAIATAVAAAFSAAYGAPAGLVDLSA
jgi:hypothetical protein